LPQNNKRDQNTTRPISLPSVLSAPWRGIAHPKAASTCFAAASPKCVLVAFLLHAALLAAVVVALAMWAATVLQTRFIVSPIRPTPTVAPRLGPLAFFVAAGSRGMGDVWSDWHANGAFGRAEWLFVATLMLVTAGALLLAWINLPLIHRSGSVSRSFGRSIRAVTSIIAVALSLVAVVGVIVVTVRLLERLGYWPWSLMPRPKAYLGILVGGAGCALLF
jgi:hypothetical protein